MQAEAKEMQAAAKSAQRSATAAQKLANDALRKASIAHDIAKMQPITKVLPPCSSFLQSYKKSTALLQQVLSSGNDMTDECSTEADGGAAVGHGNDRMLNAQPETPVPVHATEAPESAMSIQARETGDIPIVSDTDEVAVPGTSAGAMPIATPVATATSAQAESAASVAEADADAAVNLLHDDAAENMQQYVADTLTAAAENGPDGIESAVGNANTFDMYSHAAGAQAYGQTLSPVGLDVANIPTVEETMAAMPPMSSVKVPY